MRTDFHDIFKNYFRSQLLQARGKAFTQERAASVLYMSVRAYAALEGGESCCGLITFLLFLRFICPNREVFLEGLFQEWDNAIRKAREED